MRTAYSGMSLLLYTDTNLRECVCVCLTRLRSWVLTLKPVNKPTSRSDMVASRSRSLYLVKMNVLTHTHTHRRGIRWNGYFKCVISAGILQATLTKCLSLTETCSHPHPFFLEGQKKSDSATWTKTRQQTDNDSSSKNLGEVGLTSQNGDSPGL